MALALTCRARKSDLSKPIVGGESGPRGLPGGRTPEVFFTAMRKLTSAFYFFILLILGHSIVSVGRTRALVILSQNPGKGTYVS